MKTLREFMEEVWKDRQIRDPLRKIPWVIDDRTGTPAIKRKRKIKRVIARLTKEFSWRK